MKARATSLRATAPAGRIFVPTARSVRQRRPPDSPEARRRLPTQDKRAVVLGDGVTYEQLGVSVQTLRAKTRPHIDAPGWRWERLGMRAGQCDLYILNPDAIEPPGAW